MTNEPGPSPSLKPLTEVINDALAAAVWGMENTGKTLFVLRYWPLPIVVFNYDRPITRAHLGYLDKERIDNIHVLNMRESMKDIDRDEATRIKHLTQSEIEKNLDWLRGGTLLLDGGTMYRMVLKMADEKIGPALVEGRKANPREKERINAYLGQLVSGVQDQGVNLVMTGHAAFEWKVLADAEGKTSLQQTKNIYPKLDAILFERVNLSLLMFKRCQCGRNVVNQDGSCTAEGPMMTPGENHQGRRHITRIVSNKFSNDYEGTEWENLTFSTLHALCFSPDKAKLLMENNPLGKR